MLKTSNQQAFDIKNSTIENIPSNPEQNEFDIKDFSKFSMLL